MGIARQPAYTLPEVTTTTSHDQLLEQTLSYQATHDQATHDKHIEQSVALHLQTPPQKVSSRCHSALSAAAVACAKMRDGTATAATALLPVHTAVGWTPVNLWLPEGRLLPAAQHVYTQVPGLRPHQVSCSTPSPSHACSQAYTQRLPRGTLLLVRLQTAPEEACSQSHTNSPRLGATDRHSIGDAHTCCISLTFCCSLSSLAAPPLLQGYISTPGVSAGRFQ